LDNFYKSKKSKIHANRGSIEEQNKNITVIKTPKGVYKHSYLQAKATKMKKILGILVLGLSLFGCKENPSEKKQI